MVAHTLAGYHLPREEEGPTRGQGVEVASATRRKRKAPQPGQVTTSEAAEGEEAMLDGEEMAALHGVKPGGGGMEK